MSIVFPEIMTAAVVSSSHVEDADLALCGRDNDPANPVSAYPYTYGAWMSISEDASDAEMRAALLEYGYSTRFAALYLAARNSRFQYLRIDADGPVVDGLACPQTAAVGGGGQGAGGARAITDGRSVRRSQQGLALRFYSDAGHGWLAVKVAVLEALGICQQITAGSRLRGKTAYLEEDQDYGVFMRAARQAGIDLTITESICEYSPIRSYPSYTNADCAAALSQ